VVQGFSEDYRVHQGLAFVIVTVKLVDAFATDCKTGYLPVIKADTGQITALAKQEGSLKNVCCLVVGHCHHLLFKPKE